MRFRGVHHVEFSVPHYQQSISFYDRMFGWLGYASFWTLDVGYRSTYYVALPHSYIGIQPAHPDNAGSLDYRAHTPGIHHIALWARSRREVDRFHSDFLVVEGLTVTDTPATYAHYAPGYYAVFFLDPNGIRWELAYTPRLPMPWHLYQWWRASSAIARELSRSRPTWQRHPVRSAWKAMWRELPRRND